MKILVGCNSTYRLRYWNPIPTTRIIPSIINTVATVLTVYGIETTRIIIGHFIVAHSFVATVLTVYGIETFVDSERLADKHEECCNSTYRLRYWNQKILLEGVGRFPCRCNSTYRLRYWNLWPIATDSSFVMDVLQQYLPFTVLKHSNRPWRPPYEVELVATVLTVYGIETYMHLVMMWLHWLQQYLPFTVLKHTCCYLELIMFIEVVATVLTVYGIETVG